MRTEDSLVLVDCSYSHRLKCFSLRLRLKLVKTVSLWLFGLSLIDKFWICVPQIPVFLGLFLILNWMPQSPQPSYITPPTLSLSHCFPSGPQLQIFLPPYGPNPIMAHAERGVFAHSLRSSFAPKLHALVVVGQSAAAEGDLFQAVMWDGGPEKKPLFCMAIGRLCVCMKSWGWPAIKKRLNVKEAGPRILHG